jgi:Ca2+-binding RTX toxin-like protein
MAIVVGTSGDDVLQPGPGDQTAFLLNGDDQFIWNPGDGDDTVFGGGGTDTLEFNGADAVETFTVSGNDDGVELFRDVGEILMKLNQVESIQLNALGENDVIDASALQTTKVDLIVNGGTGDDNAVLGAGDDTFIWNPGEGSDVVDGQGGIDTLLFNGADVAETFTVADSGSGVQLLRDVGNIQMDLTNVERVEVNGLGDNDVIDARGVTQPVSLIADGGRGADVITGGAADDELLGRAGADTLDGGPGNDVLVGGAGADRFQFTGTGVGNDVIGDFADRDVLALHQVQLADGTPVTQANQIDTNADGLLNQNDDPFQVVNGDLVLGLKDGSATIAGLEQIHADHLEIA